MKAYAAKHDWQIDDWRKIRYVVKCHWGVKVDSSYPDPVIEEFFFEEYSDMEQFVQDYEINNQSANKKIIFIAQIGRFFEVETYQVATKVRLK